MKGHPKYIGLLICAVFFFSQTVIAGDVDLVINKSSIRFDKSNFVAGQKALVYIDVKNLGSSNGSGNVNIYLNTTQLLDGGLPVSVVPGQPDTVFTEFTIPANDFRIYAEVVSVFPADSDSSNNSVISDSVKVDLDNDQDGIGDSVDTDDDNDGLSDAGEAAKGTNPLKADTDGDGYNDNADVFPLDSSEWSDADGDGQGDNKDTDDDNDGLSDNEEAKLGTNSKKADTDGDGVSDSQDFYPQDASRSKKEEVKKSEPSQTPPTPTDQGDTEAVEPTTTGTVNEQAGEQPTLDEVNQALSDVKDELENVINPEADLDQSKVSKDSLFNPSNPMFWLMVIILAIILIILFKLKLTGKPRMSKIEPADSEPESVVDYEAEEAGETIDDYIVENEVLPKKKAIVKTAKPVKIKVRKINIKK